MIWIWSYLVFFYEPNEGGPFNLDRLSGPVVEGDDKMEEVRFPEIARRLFLEMRSSNTDTAKK